MNKIELEKNCLDLAYNRNLQILNVVLLVGDGSLVTYFAGLILNLERAFYYTTIFIIVFINRILSISCYCVLPMWSYWFSFLNYFTNNNFLIWVKYPTEEWTNNLQNYIPLTKLLALKWTTWTPASCLSETSATNFWPSWL